MALEALGQLEPVSADGSSLYSWLIGCCADDSAYKLPSHGQVADVLQGYRFYSRYIPQVSQPLLCVNYKDGTWADLESSLYLSTPV